MYLEQKINAIKRKFSNENIGQIKSNKIKVQELLGLIQEKLMNDLQTYKLKISDQQKQLNFNDSKVQQNQIKRIRIISNKTKNTIQRLKTEESTIRRQIIKRNKSINQQTKQISKQNPEINSSKQLFLKNRHKAYDTINTNALSQDKLKKLLMEFRDYENKLQQKTKLLYIKLEQERKEKQDKILVKIKETHKIHRQKAISRLDNKKHAKQKQTQINKSLKEKQKPSKSMPLFKNYEQKFNKKKQEQQKIRNIILQEYIKRRKQIEIQRIKDHEKNYMTYSKLVKKQRSKKFEELKKMASVIEQQEIKHIQKSKLYIQIEQQQKRKIQTNNHLKKEKELQKQRIIILLKKIDEKNRHNKTLQKTRIESGQQNQETNKYFTNIQKRKFSGNNYLKQSLKRIKLRSQRTKTEMTNESSSKESMNTLNYNYIHDYRKNMLKKAVSQKQFNKYEGHTVKIKRIMKSDINDDQKISNLKKIANRIECDPFSNEDQNLLNKIAVKLEILNEVNNL